MKWRFTLVLLVLLGAFVFSRPFRLLAAPVAGKSENAVAAAVLWEAIDFRLASLNFFQFQQPAKSDINPNNNLQISHQEIAAFLRPDFRATFPKLTLCFKPRFELQHNHWHDGPKKGRSKTDADLFIHEYVLSLPVSESILLSYGREDLQWGPAFLLSPSNPFFSYNGRNQPKKEVRSADYAKLIWSPNLEWSGSIIINTDQGRKKLLTDFNQTYAAKLDYLAEKAYFSLIASYQEHTQSMRLGGFLSWNLSDSTIIYGEASVSDEEVEILTGASYTFPGGSTISAEYFYNGNGHRHGSLVPKLLTLDEYEARESLFRQHYVLLQYYDHDLLSRWNILLRNTINLDDRSFSLLIHGEYNLGDHCQLFATGTLNHGDRQSELAGIIDSSLMIGLELTY
ncbi:MAG: hypothetical protein U9P07_02245 [Pseudomonadota bacterium]|nr:hypothetical protein [Pseudomonadota bacterium]